MEKVVDFCWCQKAQGKYWKLSFPQARNTRGRMMMFVAMRQGFVGSDCSLGKSFSLLTFSPYTICEPHDRSSWHMGQDDKPGVWVSCLPSLTKKLHSKLQLRLCTHHQHLPKPTCLLPYAKMASLRSWSVCSSRSGFFLWPLFLSLGVHADTASPSEYRISAPFLVLKVLGRKRLQEWWLPLFLSWGLLTRT